MKLKPNSGTFYGKEFQLWLGVKLICEWFEIDYSQSLDPPWLIEEIGRKEYGIFDDILMYKDGVYYFYQVKCPPPQPQYPKPLPL